MWQWSERSGEGRERIWDIRWSGETGVSGEDLLDAVEERLKAQDGDEGARLVLCGAGESQAPEKGEAATVVRAGELVDRVQHVMTGLAGASQKRLIIRVLASDAARSA